MTGADISFGFSDEGIQDIVLDSRVKMENALFVPIVGAHSDGHDYIEMAIGNGAAAVLSERPVEALKEKYPKVRFYRVPDTLRALQEIGYMERQRFQGTVIGVTGSVGKTTTRTMIAEAVGAEKTVFQTPGNANSQVGVPITMFRMAKSGAETAVIELGMSEPGEMERIAAVACVDMAVMTNIGIAHIENLKTQENILKEKLHILEGKNAPAVLFVNAEDPFLSGLTEESIHAMGIAEMRPITVIPYRVADHALKLQVSGQHMVLNAAAALKAAAAVGVSGEKAGKALEAFTGVRGRGARFVTRDQVTVIDDAYNASPDSMLAGIDTLMHTEGKRHIAVLADMLELGDREEAAHKTVGQRLFRERPDGVFLYGKRAEMIAAGFREAADASGMAPETEIRHFSSPETLEEALRAYLQPGDCVLFKGSNSMKLSVLVDSFRQEEMTCSQK